MPLPGAVAPESAAVAPPAQSGSETWRRFRRHRLAVASTVLLTIVIAAVLVGPFLWPVRIDEIDFAATL